MVAGWGVRAPPAHPQTRRRGVVRTRCRGYQQGKLCCAMTRHTQIVEGPAVSVTTMVLLVDDPAEVWRIGHELFPGRRLAAVNHEDEDEEE